ncbi:MAG: DMT family transporter [Chitinophagales bacterium]
MKADNKYFNFIILFLLSLIWGSSYILMKKGLVSFSAIEVGMLRICSATLVLLPFLPKAFKSLNKNIFPFLILVAFLGSGLPTYLYPLAITKIDSSMAGIINSLTPLFTMLFGWMFFQKKFTKLKVLGIFIAFLGAAVLAINFTNGWQSIQKLNKYALIAILATVCYGLSSNILSAKLKNIKAIGLTALSFFFLFPFALIILYKSHTFNTVWYESSTHKSLFYVFILGAVGTALALILFNKLIQKTDAVYATSVTYFIPIVAMLWGYFDGEILGVKHFLGITLIVIGVYIANKRIKIT